MEESEINNILVKHLAGSHAYGTNIESSDIDQRGIFCGEEVQLRTPFYRVKEQKIEGEDTSFYELANYCKLALENNPNVLETLWVDWNDVVSVTPAYGKLRENRHLFMSSKLAFTTTGYATAQLKRIKSREKHASYLPDLNILCEAIFEALNHGTIDKKWINNHCGEKVYNYFLEKFGIQDSEMEYEVEEQINSLKNFAQYADKEKELTYEVLNVICKPKQTEFISMVQNLLEERVLKFNFYDWKNNFQLVPFGSGIYGIYKRQRKRTFTDTFEIVKFFDGKREDYSKDKLSFIVKFNEKQYKEAQHNYKMFWSWYENRNEVRLEMEREYGFDCYSSDTEFLTENGWKLFDDIKDDKLATFDKNHEINYQLPTERIDNLYTGNMYNFTGQHQDTFVTANHRMYVKDWSRRTNKDMSDWKFSQACLVKKDHKVLKTISPKKNIQKLPAECYRGELELKNYLRIMGWYVSDGTMTFNKKGEPKDVSISQSKKGSILTKNITKLKNLKKIDCSHKTYKREGKLPENRWRFKKDIAQSLYKDCGHKSENKRIPNWVFLLSKRLMFFLLKSAIDGDGTKRKGDNTYIYYTINKGLADDIQRLAFCCGFESSLWGPYDNTPPVEGTRSGMYQVFINVSPESNEDINSVNNVKEVSVKGKRVVCFSVKNETLITRRNGKISLHGNCKHAMHLVRLMRIGEEVLTTGQYNVKRPDAEELLFIRNGGWTFEKIIKYTKEMDALITQKLYKETKLPHSPDVHAVANLLMEIQDVFWTGAKA